MMFDVAAAPSEALVQGLKSGILERVGGIIREIDTARVVAFLRELDGLKNVASDLAGLLGGGAALGVLNLGVATMGFMVVHRRVRGIEERLQRTQESLEHLHRKIDLGFYANFGAALNLADGAFVMRDPKNRGAHATEAINRLMEAIHHYSALLSDPRGGAHGSDAYLATLCLAHVAVARCYLELDELDLAARFLDSKGADLEALLRRQVGALLTSNPAAYLHPKLTGKVDLRRLTGVYRWLNPGSDEGTVFEALRARFCDLIERPEAWVATLPPSVWDPRIDRRAEPAPTQQRGRDWAGVLAPLRNLQLPVRLPGLGPNRAHEVYEHLPEVMSTIEGLIEDARRLSAYRTEINAIREMGIGFREWQNLPAPPGSSGLMFIHLGEPIALAA